MFVNKAHSAIICGATGSGKSEYVLDLLEGDYHHFFTYIIIVCPTWRYNKAYLNRKWLFNDPEHIFLVDPSELLPRSDDPLNDTLKVFFENYGKLDDNHVLFLIDDCSSQKGMTKKKRMLSELAFSGRHLNCSVWILTQKYNSVLTDLRTQIKWMALFFCKDRNSFEEALQENDVIPSLEERKRMRDLLAKNKHSKLILITEQPTSYKFVY
jgi:hypothetical protein